MTKTERLLKLLRKQWVTPLEALEQAGLMSLSQRCSQFIAAGMPIQKRWVDLPSGARVRAYRLGR